MPVDPVAILNSRFRDAIAAAFGPAHASADPLIRLSTNPVFGDYQSNAAMGLAKSIGKSPRDVAAAVLSHLKLGDLFESPQIAGPGFINLKLRTASIARFLDEMDDDHLGIASTGRGADHRVVVDVVGVNIAKQMHVGHLRSSIIGDCFCRIFTRLGLTAIPQNHLGDWGLQIAMVLAELRRRKSNLDTLDLDELESAYREAQTRSAASPEAMEEAKATLVSLQTGDHALVSEWNRITAVTLAACYEIYDLLDLTVTAEHNRGESFYRDRLAGIVDDLLAARVAEISDGAVIVRIEGDDTPLVIRKSDGGFLYATTDLAAIRYRVQELGAERVIYVVDARQRDHFRKVFAAIRMAGWDRLPHDSSRQADLVHIAFGAVCGPDGRPLRTRSGENVKLRDLLLEAIRRAAEIVKAKNPELPESEQSAIARAVGIGSVKYADLSTQLTKDYIFAWDRMLAFEGNTGAYLQNQYVRIRSISRKAAEEGMAPFHSSPDSSVPASNGGGWPSSAGRGSSSSRPPIMLTAPHERALAFNLLRYPDTLKSVADSLEPHRLCQYLYDLAGSFSAFYTECPVLKADTPAQRDSRLRLCRLTERVLADGLHLLGIRTLERM